MILHFNRLTKMIQSLEIFLVNKTNYENIIKYNMNSLIIENNEEDNKS